MTRGTQYFEGVGLEHERTIGVLEAGISWSGPEGSSSMEVIRQRQFQEDPVSKTQLLAGKSNPKCPKAQEWK